MGRIASESARRRFGLWCRSSTSASMHSSGVRPCREIATEMPCSDTRMPLRFSLCMKAVSGGIRVRKRGGTYDSRAEATAT